MATRAGRIEGMLIALTVSLLWLQFGCVPAPEALPELPDVGLVPDEGIDVAAPDQCAATEACNGLDDDCDGEIDEHAPQLGEACSVGVGACMAEGTWRCADDGEVACSARPSAPTDELCNAVDDDCDGEIDEHAPELDAACAVGVGACAAEGMWHCTAEGAVACSASAGEPTDESCNAVDDDCDGDVDEHQPLLGRRCTVGVGQCAADGGRRGGGRVRLDGLRGGYTGPAVQRLPGGHRRAGQRYAR